MVSPLEARNGRSHAFSLNCVYKTPKKQSIGSRVTLTANGEVMLLMIPAVEKASSASTEVGSTVTKYGTVSMNSKAAAWHVPRLPLSNNAISALVATGAISICLSVHLA